MVMGGVEGERWSEAFDLALGRWFFLQATF